MKKPILICGNHDEFWTRVAAELEDSSDFEVKVWVGKERKVSQEGKKYTSFDRHEAFHLKNFTLHGNWERIDPKRISLEDYVNFLKICDRADVNSTLSYSERNHLFFCHISYWLSLLEENAIGSIIFSNIPHTPEGYGLSVAAKILELPVIIFNGTPFPGLIYMTNEINGNMLPVDEVSSDNGRAVKKVVEPFVQSLAHDESYELWYMKKQRTKATESFINKVRNIKGGALSLGVIFISLLAGRRAKIFSSNKYLSVKRHDGVYDGAQKSTFREFAVRLRWSFYRKRLEKELRSNEENSVPKKYVYFPLHYQPEATTAPRAGFFADQQIIVDIVSRALPDGVYLVVKEHPAQLLSQNWGISGRYLGYWERINRHDNVILIDRHKDSRQLIKGSLGVVTATGTAGFEAILLGKPCFVFGQPWYVQHPSIVRLDFQTAGQYVSNAALAEERSCASSPAQGSTEGVQDFYEMLFRSLIACDIHNHAGGTQDQDVKYLAEIIARHA